LKRYTALRSLSVVTFILHYLFYGTQRKLEIRNNFLDGESGKPSL